jgi:hypothetical protein
METHLLVGDHPQYCKGQPSKLTLTYLNLYERAY